MASITAIGWFASTFSPSFTSTFKMVPGIFAPISFSLSGSAITTDAAAACAFAP